MCGIAGKLTPEPADPALLGRMCAAIEHRGPDAHGRYIDGGVAIGSQRLAIIDLERGDQPVFNEDRSVCVVLNGEIYNYRELRAELARRGHQLRSHGDTEVIAHLYEEYGDRCVEHLRGMFAFALWDRRRRRLLLARDRLGKKPLIYARRGDRLWFASEAKAILQDAEITRAPDLVAIDQYLQLGYVPDPLTGFAALRKLPPAHVAVWEAASLTTRRYWALSYEPKPERQTPPERAERIRDALLEATRLRLRSDVALGAFLSGGIDSSAVVAAMARTGGGRIKTFSIGFEHERYDETAHAREVATLYDTDHHEFRVRASAVDVLPRLSWHYDQPFADASAIPTFLLCELTRREVTVALSGDGGDESFAGYDRYHAHGMADRLHWVPAAGATGLERVLRRSGLAGRLAPARRLAWLSRAATLELHDRYGTVDAFGPAEKAWLYTPETAAAATGASAAQLLREAYARSDAKGGIDRLMALDVATYLPGDLLVKTDIASMASSLEVRCPLLDHELMELAARLPEREKRRGSRGKLALREALRPWLPASVLDRPKMGFSVPMADWMRSELQRLPSDVLLDRRARERGLFRPGAVERMISEHTSGARDHAQRLWTLIGLELWLRTYVDGPVPAPVTA